MADLDLNDLAVFVRVVEREGFAKAARELGVPTSTVSRTVQRLEEIVGARLLHRTTRSVRPTPEGRDLFANVSGAVTTLQAAARGLEPASRRPKGRLRVTAPNDIGSTFLADLVVEFTERHPLVQIDLLLTNRTVNLVDEEIDLAIRAGRLTDSSLVARKIGDLATALYASPRYLEKHGTPTTIAELDDHHCVVFRAKDLAVDWPLHGPEGEVDVAVRGRIGGDDFTFVRAVLLAGGGVGMLPRIVCAQDELDGRLVRVLPTYEMRVGSLHCVYPSAHNVPARVTAFRDFVVEAFADRVARCTTAGKERANKRAGRRGGS